MIDLTINELLKNYKTKKLSPVEVTKSYIERIKKYQPILNSYITTTFDRALEDAKKSENRYLKDENLELDGIPICMKDLYATKGIRTTAGSKILSNFIPQYESTISQKFIDSGSVLLGKSNLDEFAMGTFSKTSYFGAPINPYQIDKKLTAGGSSGGTTSAISGGLAVGGTGSDTGGSIRFPASITGLVGFKPTYGVCSRFGCIAFASSLDTPGPIARNVEDTTLLFKAMMGYDEKDSTSVNKKLDEQDVKKCKIGIIKEFQNIQISDDMKTLFTNKINDLKQLGFEIVEVSIPNILNSLGAYYIIAPAEASSNLARYDGMRYGLRKEAENLEATYEETRTDGFGTEVKRRILLGSAVMSKDCFYSYYIKACKVRRLIASAFASAFSNCDFIICPSSSGTAVPLDSDLTPKEYWALDLFTVGMNLANVPACSIPIGLAKNNLPLGMQVIGKSFDDLRVLKMSKIIENTINFDNRPTIVLQ